MLWFIRGNAVTFAIRLKDGTLIGCVSLGVSKKDERAELGYWIGQDYWNKGYATEASFACIEFGFNHFNLNKISCRHLGINPSSGRVMEKLGMTKEGYLKQHFKKNGIFHDVVEYGLLRKKL